MTARQHKLISRESSQSTKDPKTRRHGVVTSQQHHVQHEESESDDDFEGTQIKQPRKQSVNPRQEDTVSKEEVKKIVERMKRFLAKSWMKEAEKTTEN